MAPARRWPVISALGVVQILTWGSSFYLLSVLAAPMSADTGWPLGWVIGGLSLGLLVAGLASSRVGTYIGEHGGRPVLAFAAVALAVGLAILGLAPNLPTYLEAGSSSASAWAPDCTTPPSPRSGVSTAPRQGPPSPR